MRTFIFFFLLSVIGYSQPRPTQTYTQLADSLDLAGEYSESLKYRELVLKTNGTSKVLKAKWCYTQSCIYESKGGQDNHRKALEYSIGAYKLTNEIGSDKNVFFQYLILNRVYHQYGYLGKWKQALSYAKKDLEVLLDTLPVEHIRALRIFDDLGYIYTLQGDPEKANDYYEKSHILYRKYHPGDSAEIYVNSDRVAENYKSLGLRQDEFRLLSAAENYWNHLSSHKEAFYQRFITYRKLADWYNFYGDYKLAENYLNKQEKLFDSVSVLHKKTEQKALDRRDLLAIYADYIQLYYNTEDFNKAEEYIALSKDLLTHSNRYYIWDVKGEINLCFLQSKLPDNTLDESIGFLKQAIELALSNKERFFTNPTPYEIELAKRYSNSGLYQKALETVSEILESETLNDHLRFQLYCQKGTLLSQLTHDGQALISYKEAITSILKNPKSVSDFSALTLEQLKAFYTYDTLEGMLKIGHFYLQLYRKEHQVSDFQNAFNSYLLASGMFSEIYIGDIYNPRLFRFYKEIEQGLIHCSLLKNDSAIVDSSIEALENNASKLTWSKFVYNQTKQQLKVPDSILNVELKLKSLINYYQTKIYEAKEESNLPPDSLSRRITDLNGKLRKHQEFVRENYSNYYTRSSGHFSIEALKQQLNEDQLVVKFSFIDTDLFAFVIDKKQSAILQLSDKTDIKMSIATYVKDLSVFDSEIRIPKELSSLAKKLLEFNKNQLTILPAETLNLLPFETLIPDYFNSNVVIGYSSSLNLYHEQLKTIEDKENLTVGIFTGQDEHSFLGGNYLPSVSKEINVISKNCPSVTFYQATKADFLAQASSFKVLHLAMHSTIDNENPELSSLNFYNQDLLVGELYNESMDSDMVVLSACDTGNGQMFNGEGIQSVSKAFTYAGVPSTVMSLWKVDDKATAILMGSFYKYLNAGKPKDVALKWAKRDYVNSTMDSELKHPYYWSGFVISGNVEPFKVQENHRKWWLSLLIVPLAILFFYRKSKFGK